MIFVLDNYDSFTYNLVQYLGELGAEVRGGAERRDDGGGRARAGARRGGHLPRAGHIPPMPASPSP